MAKKPSPDEATFGKLAHKVAINPKLEIHIKTGAKNGTAVNLSKFVKTKSYVGPAGGLMIPNASWKDFQKAVAATKVKVD